MNAAKLKQAELWQLEKRDARIKAQIARILQSVDAKRKWLSKLATRVKHGRIDN